MVGMVYIYIKREEERAKERGERYWGFLLGQGKGQLMATNQIYFLQCTSLECGYTTPQLPWWITFFGHGSILTSPIDQTSCKYPRWAFLSHHLSFLTNY